MTVMVHPPPITAAVLALLRDAEGPPLTVVTGPTGGGLTTLLDSVASVLRADGRGVVRAWVQPDGVVTPEGRAVPGDSPLPVVRGARRDAATARRAAVAAATSLARSPHTRVLLDDAQWLDHDGVAVLEALVHRLVGSPVRYLCAVSVPPGDAVAAAGPDALARLRRAGLVTTLRLRPLDPDDTARVLREVVGAEPAPELLRSVRASSRGVVAAVRDAAAELDRRGLIRRVDRHGYLAATGPARPGDLRGAHLVTSLRRGHPEVFAVARAAALLAPVGPGLGPVLARALGVDDERVDQRLQALRRAGVLHRSADKRWRFVVPLTAEGLRDDLGRYERRHLAALAVDAAWRGETAISSSLHADLVADAGRLVLAGRAYGELTAAIDAPLSTDPRRIARWTRAAVDVADGPTARTTAVVRHVVACFIAGDAATTMTRVRKLLADDSGLPPEGRDTLRVMLVAAIHGSGDLDCLAAVADGAVAWPEDDAAVVVARSLAMALLDRWRDARALLERTRPTWSATRYTRGVGFLVEGIGELLAGDPRQLHAGLAVRSPAPGDDERLRWRQRLDAGSAALVVLGDVAGVDALLDVHGLARADLPGAPRAVLALYAGGSDAADAARRAVAEAPTFGFDAARTVLYQLLAVEMICGGRLSAARDLLSTAHRAGPVLGHVLAAPDASIDLLLGDPDAAVARLERALDRAAANDLVVGTDTLLALLVQVHHARGGHRVAIERAQALDRVAATLATPMARAWAAFGRALTEQDHDSARRAPVLAHEGGQLALAAHLEFQLITAGVADPAGLPGIYAFYGRSDALLARAWTRTAMAAHGVPVPGRAATKAENEQLLGRLLTEGLTNRQIGTILGSSERSVEGRLGRLLARTGHRSRIELATALLAGSFRG